MKANYNCDIFKQLEETLKRLDKMESTLYSVKTEHGECNVHLEFRKC